MHDEPATLLLVEDDLAVRTFLADNLTADGFELVVAETARDAVRLLEHAHPDLALLDLGLPDGSGFELLRRIRDADGAASRIDPGLPVILLTGRAGELDRIRGFDRGADDFVTKPSLKVVAPGATAPGANGRGTRLNTDLPSSSSM